MKTRKINLFINVMVTLSLMMMLLGSTSIPASAKNEDSKADPRLLEMAEEYPDETFMVIVQREMKNKDLEDDAPEVEVEKVGGRVKKQLDIIESFSAELLGKEIEKLAKHPKVRWISFDAPLVSTAVSDPRVRDEFSAASYSNNNGTNHWTSNWTEIYDDNTPAGGYVKVANGSLQLKFGNRGVNRQANLSGVVFAALSFQYKRSSFDDANDVVALQVSSNGGATWTELARYAGPGTDSAWQPATFYIQNYATSNTQIRFATSSLLGSADVFYIDNVQIEYASASKFTSAIRANELWNYPFLVKGQGVTVAVVDSGISNHTDFQGSNGGSRIIASTNQTSEANASDGYGHGTHVAGIIGGNGTLANGVYSGVAPAVNLINVKVSNQQGMATTSDLIDGLQWININRTAYNIRVVNISLNSTVAESYHTSPLDAAVEILWFNGIVVVVAAGNNGTGSAPVTLYPPANDPFVITVGASEDKGTATLSDDTIASFSAYGSTEDGFAKPDLVAPGRHVVSLLAGTSSQAYLNHPAHRVNTSYFRMSGTSMSAPVVSGAVALLLLDEWNLNPDQVKFRLMATANKNWTGYNAAKAGAGYLDIYAAIFGSTTGTANTGIRPSQLLSTGSEPISWGSVGWNSVGWNSVGWNSVGWNSVGWNSAGWNSNVWDEKP
jgi:serine protease AprX